MAKRREGPGGKLGEDPWQVVEGRLAAEQRVKRRIRQQLRESASRSANDREARRAGEIVPTWLRADAQPSGVEGAAQRAR